MCYLTPDGKGDGVQGGDMNERIIKVAHLVAVGIMLLVGVAAVTS